MRYTGLEIANDLLSIILLVFGVDRFVQILPIPLRNMPPEATIFMDVLNETGYMYPLVGIVYIIAGVCLAFDTAEPFALIIIAPISINTIAFHLKFDPTGIAPAGIIALLNIILLYSYSDRYRNLFY